MDTLFRKFIVSVVWMLIGLLISILTNVCAAQTFPPGTKHGFVRAEDGVRIHYVQAGKNGLPLLLIPGWTMTADIWEHQLAFFSKTNLVIAIDPRGQGDSDKPTEGNYPAVRARDVKAVIQQLKLTQVVLVGWSMGVIDMAAYVEQFGTAGIAGIVLVDGLAGADADSPQRGAFMSLAAGVLAERAKQNPQFIRSMYRQQHEEAYYKRIEADALKTPTSIAVSGIVGFWAHDHRPGLDKIDVPSLVIAAGDDKSNPWVARYKEMVQRMKGGRLEMMPGCGHAAFADCPSEFNALLAGFLRELNAKGKM